MGLLNSLIESADRFKDDLLPVGYAEREITWVVNIDPTGNHPVTVQRRNKGELRINAPESLAGRTSGTVLPNLLVDKPSYALGIADNSKKGDAAAIAKNEHNAFVALAKKAATVTKSPVIAQIASWFENTKQVADVRRQMNVKPYELVAFQVDSNPWPTDSLDSQRFWSSYVEELLAQGNQQCAICGISKPILRILPFKAQVFAKVQLSSFNEEAFCSHGNTTKSPNNSSICFACAGTAARVLQHLLKFDKSGNGKQESSGRHAVVLARDGRKNDSLENQVAVFWTKQPVYVTTADGDQEAEDLARLTLEDLEKAPDEGPPVYATQLRGMLETPWKGGANKTSLIVNRFYLAVLSPNKSRLVVREWLEEDVAKIRDSLRRYVNALEIIHPDGRHVWFPPLPAILDALQSPVSKKKKSDEKARLPQVEPDLMRKLIRCMFTGAPSPAALLTRALRCFRVPDPPTEDRQQRERQMLRRMALAAAMKLVLTHHLNEQEQLAMEQLNSENPGSYQIRSPYLCGRLLAVLEEIQRQASGKPGGVNTTLVDRFYGSASTAPASVFGNLINMTSKAHLPKLRREGRDFISDLMNEVCRDLDKAGGFPPPLLPEEQAQFALGFYHQRAEFASKRREAAKKRQQQSAATKNSEENQNG